MSKNVSRVQFIEIITPTSWMIDGVLWRFRSGTEIAVGGCNELEGVLPMVKAQVAMSLIKAQVAMSLIKAQVAMSLINANRAQPSDTTSLDADTLKLEEE